MKGFTLVELMIVIFIFSIILGTVFAVMTMTNTSWYSGSTQVEVQEEARKGINRMVRELRESSSSSGKVNITNGGSTITFQVPADWDNDNDVIDNSGIIEWGAPLHLFCKNPDCEDQNDNCHYINYGIRYLLSNDQLLRRVLSSYPTGSQIKEDVLANNISSVQFSGTNTIDIQITAQKNTIKGHPMDITLNSKVRLKN